MSTRPCPEPLRLRRARRGHVRLPHVPLLKPDPKEWTRHQHLENARPRSASWPKTSQQCVSHKKLHNVRGFFAVATAFPLVCMISELGRISRAKWQDVVCSCQTAVSSLLPYFLPHPQNAHA